MPVASVPENRYTEEKKKKERDEAFVSNQANIDPSFEWNWFLLSEKYSKRAGHLFFLFLKDQQKSSKNIKKNNKKKNIK